MKYLTFLLTIALTFSGISASAQSKTDDVLRNVERFGRFLIYLNGNYVDTINADALTNAAIKEILEGLDPHSVFIPKEEVQSTNEPLTGSFEGIGIEFAIISDTLCVQNVIIGGPSEAVGLMAGDKIVSVDGQNIAGVKISNEGVRKCLRGPRGTKVELIVRRHGVNEPMDFTIVRDKIPLNSIDAAYCPKPGVLYVKLSRFAQNSIYEFIDALKTLNAMPKGMIVDLRGNGGGYMQIALMLADIFLEKGQTILFTEGLHSPVRYEYASGSGFFRSGPLAVLVDEESASASEIFAGAMQDWDRGVIIGRRTFGKGLVQQQYPLSDGSQIRVTVSRYHTPSGRVIQTPYENGRRTEYYDKLNERYKHGELFSRDSIQFPDSLKYTTKKLGRTVYGGGGIMPDIFIPGDTTGVNGYFSSVIRKGYLTEYANQFIDSHRPEIVVKGRSFEDFYKAYDDFGKDALSGLVDYCRSKGLEPSDNQLQECGKQLATRLKALVARAAFNTTGYYRVINMEEDQAFEKAMEVISSWSGPFPAL